MMVEPAMNRKGLRGVVLCVKQVGETRGWREGF